MARGYFLTPFWTGSGAPRFPLRPGRQIIGRSHRAAIPVHDPSVSRQHAAVEVVEGEVWLEDLGSKHGTFVNSQRIARTRLRVGDLIIVGMSAVLRLDREVERSSDQTAALPQLRQAEVGGDSLVERSVTWPGALTSELELADHGPALSLQPPDLRSMGRLCLDALPSIYARLNMILDQLRQLGEKPGAKADPAVVLTWLEPVLDRVAGLMTAVTGSRDGSPPEVLLEEVVAEALRGAASTLAEREVEVHRQIPPGLGLRAEPRALAGGLAVLLSAVGACAEPASIMTISARPTEGGTEVELALSGNPPLHHEGAPGEALYRARQVLEDAGARLSAGPGKLCLFISDWETDEYSSGH